MKIRSGFVSNSSSSSFVFISKGDTNPDRLINEKRFFSEDLYLDGEYEFGWDFIKYTSYRDKFNWLYLQLCYMKLYAEFENANETPYQKTNCAQWKKYYNRVRNCIRDTTGLDIDKEGIKLMVRGYNGKSFLMNIHNLFVREEDDAPLEDSRLVEGYIDHQSSVREDFELIQKIFESDMSLYRFLFDMNSGVSSGNDNEDHENLWNE